MTTDPVAAPPPEPRRDPERPVEVWHALSRLHARLSWLLDARLQDRHGLSLTGYEVLSLVVHAPGPGRSMSRLAEDAGLSPAGVTRVVGRLVGDGLVVQLREAADRRLLQVRPTPEGRRRHEAATVTYEELLRAHLLEPFGSELAPVAAALRRAAVADARGR